MWDDASALSMRPDGGAQTSWPAPRAADLRGASPIAVDQLQAQTRHVQPAPQLVTAAEVAAV